MHGMEWRHIPKGSIFKGKTVPQETWFAVLKTNGLIVGTVTRGPDDRWIVGYLNAKQERVILYKTSALTPIEARQVWEHEFTEYVRAQPRNR